MIYGNLKNDDLRAYPPAIGRALTWLREHDAPALAPGRYEIEGEDIFAMVQEVTTRPMEGSVPEAHRRYIDLMYWPERGERIGVARLDGSEPVAEDRPENDVYFLRDVQNEQFLRTGPGDFCVFFPEDAHRPALHPAGEPVRLRKLVVKIALALLQ